MDEMSRIFESVANNNVITITRKEHAEGCVKSGVEVYVSCEKCSGTGDKDKENIQICTYCRGKGAVEKTRKLFFGNAVSNKKCKCCKGSGRLNPILNPCNICSGTGCMAKSIDIHIPAGFSSNHLVVKPTENIEDDFEVLISIIDKK